MERKNGNENEEVKKLIMLPDFSYIIFTFQYKHSKSDNSKPKSPCNFLILLAYFIFLPNCPLPIAIQYPTHALCKAPHA